MTAKNITTNSVTENGVEGAGNAGIGAAAVAVGARPSGAAGDVWDALTGNPGATVAALVEASGVSRAAVARTLTALERDGRATRTRGGHDGGKRHPDTWHPSTATVDAAADASTTDTTTGDADATADSSDAPDAPTTTLAATGGTAPTSIDMVTGSADAGDSRAEMDPAAVAGARDALTALQDAIGAALTALDAGDGAAALTAAEGAYSGSGLMRRSVRAAAKGRRRTASGALHLAPGEMRAKVAAHLAAHPGAAFTPHEVAKVIGHSAGAISNALDRLVEAGDAELVCDQPRRFTTTVRGGAPSATD